MLEALNLRYFSHDPPQDLVPNENELLKTDRKHRTVWLKGNHQVSIVDTFTFEEMKIISLFGSSHEYSSFLPLKVLALDDSDYFEGHTFFLGQCYDNEEYYLSYTQNIYNAKEVQKSITKIAIDQLIPEVRKLTSFQVFKSKYDKTTRPVILAIGCRNIYESETTTFDRLRDNQVSVLCLTLDLGLKWLIKLDTFTSNIKFGGMYRAYTEPKVGYGDTQDYSVLSLEKREL